MASYVHASRIGIRFLSAILLVLSASDLRAGNDQKLTASDATGRDQFGASVAASGDFVIVGSPESRSAYIFENAGGLYEQVAKLAPLGNYQFDGFAVTTAISGSTAVVGAPQDSEHGGAVYVFENVSGAWTLHAKLTPLDSQTLDYFGRSISISDNVLVVGAPGACFDELGRAYVFEKVNGSWQQVKKLTYSAPKMKPGDCFGKAVAISGSTAFVAAPYYDESPDTLTGKHGAVFTFERDSAGGWAPARNGLPILGDIARTEFGLKMAAADGACLVGGYGDAYLIEKIGDEWRPPTKLSLARAWPASGDFQYISSLALSGRVAVVGNARDGVYVFENVNGVWGEKGILTSPDGGPNDRFGSGLALEGSLAFVGASGAYFGTEPGSLYVIDTQSAVVAPLIPRPILGAIGCYAGEPESTCTRRHAEEIVQLITQAGEAAEQQARATLGCQASETDDQCAVRVADEKTVFVMGTVVTTANQVLAIIAGADQLAEATVRNALGCQAEESNEACTVRVANKAIADPIGTVVRHVNDLTD